MEKKLPFQDIKETDRFYNDVLYLYEHGYMVGVKGSTFAPGANISRAMAITVLWRVAGKPKPLMETLFPDCKKHWAKEAISWAAEWRIVEGFGGKNLDPDAEITREQAAAIFYRYEQNFGSEIKKQEDSAKVFADAKKIADWARSAVDWVVSQGIFDVYRNADKKLNPKKAVTRGEFATILYRFLTRAE